MHKFNDRDFVLKIGPRDRLAPCPGVSYLVPEISWGWLQLSRDPHLISGIENKWVSENSVSKIS